MRNEAALLHNLSGTQTRVCHDELLARHCTWRTGGAASLWIEPADSGAVQHCLAWSSTQGYPLYVVGLGSNLMFPDEGIDGVVLRLAGELATWARLDGTSVYVGAGVVNAHLVKGLLKEGLVGAEFLVLIPGTFGGAVAMNAGTKEKELSSILKSVTLLVPSDEEHTWHVETWDAEALNLSYRHASLPKGAVVLGGEIELEAGDVEHARSIAQEDKARRNKTQPYRLASVGSTFANPQGDHAGRLIDAAGLKGHCIGGACISPLHANFFINQGGATSDEFLRLMALARHEVRTRFGVELRPEVQFVGFDGWERMAQHEADLMRQI